MFSDMRPSISDRRKLFQPNRCLHSFHSFFQATYLVFQGPACLVMRQTNAQSISILLLSFPVPSFPNLNHVDGIPTRNGAKWSYFLSDASQRYTKYRLALRRSKEDKITGSCKLAWLRTTF
jgi:hypothetical protein